MNEQALREALERTASRARTSPDGYERIMRRVDARRTSRRLQLALGLALGFAVVLLLAVPILRSPTLVDIAPGTSLADWSWQRTGLGAPGVLHAAAAGDEVVVAVGTHATGAGAFWRSVDRGLTWELSGTPALDDELRAVARFGELFVAAGTGGVWVSGDGSTWGRVELAGAGQLYDAAVGDGRVVVAGRGPGSSAGVWWSDDGYRWQAAPVEGGDAGAENAIFTVAYGAAGFAAMGYGPGPDGIVNVWTAADGARWTHVEHEGLEPGSVVDVLTSDERSYLAVQAGGALWRSADAVRWSFAGWALDGRMIAERGSRMARYGTLLRAGTSWIAAGSTEDEEGGRRAAIWATSEMDRMGWQPIYDESPGEDGRANLVQADVHGGTVLPDGSLILVGTQLAPCPTCVTDELWSRVWLGTSP